MKEESIFVTPVKALELLGKLSEGVSLLEIHAIAKSLKIKILTEVNEREGDTCKGAPEAL